MFCDLVVKDTKVRPGTGRSEKVKLTHSYPQEPVNKMFLKVLHDSMFFDWRKDL